VAASEEAEEYAQPSTVTPDTGDTRSARDASDLGAARGAVTRRYRTVGLILLSVVGAAGVGWFAGSQLSTPEQIAADAAPPPASNVTAAVERRSLAESLITRGDARFDDPIEVAFPSGSTRGGDIVTDAPERGASVEDGDLLFELSGAPVLALEGDSPMYRDLGPGDQGRDVMQLEVGLERLGYEPGAVDGVYDADTSAAVRRWQEALGYATAGPSDAAESEIEAARDAVESAERSLRDAERSVEEAREAPSLLTLLEQESAVDDARKRAEEAETRAADDLAAAELTVAKDGSALEIAEEMNRRFVNGQGPPSLRVLVEDRWDLEVLAAAKTPSPEASARVEGLEWVLAQVKDAEVAFDVADPDERWDAARVDLADIERRARDAFEVSDLALERARVDGAQTVADAREAVTLAELRLIALKNPSASEGLRNSVDDAEERLAEAQADLGTLLREHDTGVRAAHLVFFDSLPVRVNSVSVEDGDVPNGTLMTVSGTQLVIETSIPLSFAEVVQPGARASVDSANLGIDVGGEVSFVADEPGTNGLTAQQVYAEIVPDEQPPGLLDASVRVVIPLAESDGEVLAVPVAALFTAADGSTQVRVERAGGAVEALEVTVGLRADGFAEVTPVDGELTEGDRVVVGAG
jgi:peptidoglycan hydrolase-like protein with peptidoglycan-binding domain